jgi:DNA-binding NarL/FixJ family response regulator
MPDEPLRVLLAEDHTIVREGLRALLEGQPDIVVAGEAIDGAQAVEQTRALKPQVVVMDLAMPGMGGVEATRQIREACPETRVLVLSMHEGEEHVRPALRAGACGYLLKGSGLSDLVKAIREVARGNAFFSPQVAKLLLTERERDPLSQREREVLRLVADGRSSPQIGALLGISAKTVENHRSSIMRKLDRHDVASLVKYAIRTGLVET